jgi:hypothetical protein
MSTSPKSFLGPIFFGLLLTGCSQSPVALTPGSNPADEISALNTSLEIARGVQVDVLAAANFEIATDYLALELEAIKFNSLKKFKKL